MKQRILKGAVIAFVLSLLVSTSYALDNPSLTSTPTSTNEQTQQQSFAAKNKMEGDKFLAENKLKPGVVTLPDGLQYKVITEGKGDLPKENDTVTVNYVGTLINGTEFDSSYKRGQSATFNVNGVIPGWSEALQLMTVGSTWELYIPSSLAYGEYGSPPTIGPNQTLIFKVHLIAINKT